MTKNLSSMSDEQLVERFIEIAIAQADAITLNQNAHYNRLFDRKRLVEEELRKRPGDQRRLLVQLYDHPGIYVQLKAAFATLAVEPDAARAVLREIGESQDYPAAAEARLMLLDLERGRYVPT